MGCLKLSGIWYLVGQVNSGPKCRDPVNWIKEPTGATGVELIGLCMKDALLG
jgi:hypothetical protein